MILIAIVTIQKVHNFFTKLQKLKGEIHLIKDLNGIGPHIQLLKIMVLYLHLFVSIQEDL